MVQTLWLLASISNPTMVSIVLLWLVMKTCHNTFTQDFRLIKGLQKYMEEHNFLTIQCINQVILKSAESLKMRLFSNLQIIIFIIQQIIKANLTSI